MTSILVKEWENKGTSIISLPSTIIVTNLTPQSFCISFNAVLLTQFTACWIGNIGITITVLFCLSTTINDSDYLSLKENKMESGIVCAELYISMTSTTNNKRGYVVCTCSALRIMSITSITCFFHPCFLTRRGLKLLFFTST